MLIAGVLALGACAESAPEADTATEAEAATEDAGVDMSAWEGSYNIAYEDGSEATLAIAADGAYSATSGEETVSGAITMGEGGSFCYTAEGSEETECWTNGEAAEDGSWTSTSDSGATATVRRVEEEAEAETDA
jgi:hypothetical protein